MKKQILNAAGLTLGPDGRVEISDEQLLEIERHLLVTPGGAGGLVKSCQQNSNCGTGSTWFNSACSNSGCTSDGSSFNEMCDNFNCSMPDTSNGACAKLVTKPF